MSGPWGGAGGGGGVRVCVCVGGGGGGGVSFEILNKFRASVFLFATILLCFFVHSNPFDLLKNYSSEIERNGVRFRPLSLKDSVSTLSFDIRSRLQFKASKLPVLPHSSEASISFTHFRILSVIIKYFLHFLHDATALHHCKFYLKNQSV